MFKRIEGAPAPQQRVCACIVAPVNFTGQIGQAASGALARELWWGMPARGVADCYVAQGLPWLIPAMPRKAFHSFIPWLCAA